MYKYDFSFIVPVYNNEIYIDECIESIIKQKYDFDRLQIILINDGSSDNSSIKCQYYSDKYPNVIFINQKNQGVSVARNNGIKAAEGKYILFLDSDDFVSVNLCEEIFNFFEKNYEKVDIVTFPLINYKNNKYTTHFRYAKLYGDKNCIFNINKNPEVIQTTINVCIKNNRDNKLQFDELMSFAEDEKFVTQIIMAKRKIGYCSNCSYYYRKNESSTTKKYYISDKQFINYTQYYRELLNQYPRNIYIRNLFLNSLRWRIQENKLFPIGVDKKNVKNYKEIIRSLLKKISVEDILSFSILKKSIVLAILELKGINYTLTKKKNNVILKIDKTEYIFDDLVTIVVKKLDYDKFPVVEGNITCNFVNTKIINSEYSIYCFELTKNYLYKDSYINNVFNYNFRMKFIEKNYIDFTKLYNRILIKSKNKTYKLKYVISIENNKLVIKRMLLRQKIKKLLTKIRNGR